MEIPEESCCVEADFEMRMEVEQKAAVEEVLKVELVVALPQRRKEQC